MNFGVDSHIWNFQWKAPSILQDTIIFYFAGIAANQLISVPTGDFFMNNLAISATTVNLPPIASDQNMVIEPDSTLLIDLSNSSFDPNGDSLTYLMLINPDSGTVTQVGPGTLQYVPNPGFAGLDSIMYQICDGAGLCDTGWIYIQLVVIPGIAEPNTYYSLQVFPNPVTNSFTIEFDARSGEEYSLFVYTALGRQIRKMDRVTSGQLIEGGEELPPGMYMFELRMDDLTIGGGRFIVQ